MLLDIVILPPDKTAAAVGKKIKQAAKNFPHGFIVDNQAMIPHLSLWHIKTSKNRIIQLSQDLKSVAVKQKPIKISSSAFVESKNHKGVVEFLVRNSRSLILLQQKVFETTYPYKTGMMPQFLMFEKWSGKELLQARKYSRPLGFKPHFTMAHIKSPEGTQKIIGNMNKIKFTFEAKEIYVCEVNRWWQVTRIIKKFKLNNPSSVPPKRDIFSRKGRRKNEIDHAVKILKTGGIVVYPTDTSYGLAVDATNLAAVKKLYRLKGRNFRKPIHVIAPLDKSSHTPVYGRKWLNRIVRVNARAAKLMEKFWPGALTIVLPLKAKERSWRMLSAGTGTIGVRYPANSTAQALVEALGRPITATSANVSGKPAAYSIAEAKRQFLKHRLYQDITFLGGGKLPKRKPSTVLSLAGRVKIIRAGPIIEREIKNVLFPKHKP